MCAATCFHCSTQSTPTAVRLSVLGRRCVFFQRRLCRIQSLFFLLFLFFKLSSSCILTSGEKNTETELHKIGFNQHDNCKVCVLVTRPVTSWTNGTARLQQRQPLSQIRDHPREHDTEMKGSTRRQCDFLQKAWSPTFCVIRTEPRSLRLFEALWRNNLQVVQEVLSRNRLIYFQLTFAKTHGYPAEGWRFMKAEEKRKNISIEYGLALSVNHTVC